MAQKPSERPIWFLPLVGFLIPVGVGGIFLGFQSLQWSGGEKKSIVDPKNQRPPSSPTPPPTVPSVSAPKSPAPTEANGLSTSEMSLYSSEISKLSIKAKEYLHAVEEVRKLDTSGTGEGVGSGGWIKAKGMAKYQEQASHKTSVVACLENQRTLGVPFYQGKATCTAALPEPVTPQED